MAAKKSASKTARKAAKKARKRVGKQAGKQAGKKAAKRVSQQATERAAKRAARSAVREVVERVERKAPERAAKKAAKPTARRAIRNARKRASDSLGPAQLVDLVERYVSAFNAGDVDAILSYYHPRATMEDPVGYAPARGRQAIGAVYRGGFRQGVTIALDGAVRCAGHAVAFPVVARTPTATLHSVNIFELGNDGLIERMRAYWGPYNVVGEISVRG
jgi:steroid delta-isomerase